EMSESRSFSLVTIKTLAPPFAGVVYPWGLEAKN
ncbi:unnamed protein product, partial [marine sediment metagenome]